MPSFRSLIAPVTAVWLLSAATAAAQAPPPDAEWLTIRTEHFRVTFTPELETLGREAAGVAERVYAVLEDELPGPPTGPVDLIITDHVDYTNGFARPFFSNRVVLYARPPVAMPNLAYSRDWLELVVAHELVHTFHLDVSGGFGRVVRGLFGRVPSTWPIFPVAGSPSWSTEGLATHYESRLTGAGRIHGSYHDMVIRTAVLEDALPGLDEVSVPNPVWPGGTRSYVYGARLMRYIADSYGEEAHRDIIDATAGSLRPTFLAFDHIAGDAVGRDFDRIYDDWRRAARDSARSTEGRIRGRGVTPTTAVAGSGPYARFPRVSPDGGTLAFTEHDYRSDPATRLVDLEDGGVRTLARRSQVGDILEPTAWLPDGRGLVVAQLERHGPYRTWSDLWRVGLDGEERRLTDGARLSSPAAAPDGRRVAAIRGGAGSLDLVVVDLESGAMRVLVPSAPGEGFAAVRWSPDGRWIAGSRFAAGRVDLVVVDPESGAVRTVTSDDALDMAPAWSPDGQWLVWWSDRSGVPNVYAVDPDRDAALRQVTNVLTGAVDPEVSPDGRTLYVSVYHHDGWRIEALPFDPDRWLEALPSVMAYGPALLPAPVRAGSPAPSRYGGPEGDAATGAADGAPAPADAVATPYSALPTLRPYFWVPSWTTASVQDTRLRFLGVSVTGEDALIRHSWSAWGAVDVGGTGRFQARGTWTWRGLGNPELSVTAGRDWDGAGLVELADGSEAVFRRTDFARLSAVLWRPRWWNTAWLRTFADLEREEFVPHSRTAAELAAEEIVLRDLPTTLGGAVAAGYSNARSHPYSVSPESGASVSTSVGRWWDLDSGGRAYDQLIGSLAGYLGFRGWGFANHVLAARLAGLARFGERPSTSSIGGVPGVAQDLLVGPRFGTSFLPVRGYDSGVRGGTRAWAASAEWRFPIHLRSAPAPRILGFSLTSLAGSVFVDAGDAWCTRDEAEEDRFSGCPDPGLDPLVSAGAELIVDFGLFHNTASIVRLGVAQPVRGPGDRPTVYLGVGRAF
jgi:Tol biopolymer transport system component